ncbi:hypothetical protein NBE98_09555 [Clostridium swellfunianum]|uniref:hypothetical protein n=1 Tax=Clostridium swellfunianum TaxID=1367462 RepID=UPI00202F63E1|nr:hypothetical protein [Clostridium swellfunianum]MCM0648618.1 hypothetical protein [Clostridium swellfunianum]
MIDKQTRFKIEIGLSDNIHNFDFEDVENSQIQERHKNKESAVYIFNKERSDDVTIEGDEITFDFSDIESGEENINYIEKVYKSVISRNEDIKIHYAEIESVLFYDTDDEAFIENFYTDFDSEDSIVDIQLRGYILYLMIDDRPAIMEVNPNFAKNSSFSIKLTVRFQCSEFNQFVEGFETVVDTIKTRLENIILKMIKEKRDGGNE